MHSQSSQNHPSRSAMDWERPSDPKYLQKSEISQGITLSKVDQSIIQCQGSAAEKQWATKTGIRPKQPTKQCLESSWRYWRCGGQQVGGERGRRAGINDMQCCIQMRLVAVPTVSAIGPCNFVFNWGSTATTSSEFKQYIQPTMDGYVPTTVDIWWGSILLFHMSLWKSEALQGCAVEEQWAAKTGRWRK